MVPKESAIFYWASGTLNPFGLTQRQPKAKLLHFPHLVFPVFDIYNSFPRHKVGVWLFMGGGGRSWQLVIASLQSGWWAKNTHTHTHTLPHTGKGVKLWEEKQDSDSDH